MPAASLEELRIRADRIVRRAAPNDCGCFGDQTPVRVSVGCVTFVMCRSCGGRITHDRRRLTPSSAFVQRASASFAEPITRARTWCL
jgi:hypothetical protein